MAPIRTPVQAGAALVSRRQALRLSQEEVATRLGISQNRMSVLEKHPDRITLDRLLALANLLGLELTLQPKATLNPPVGTEW